MQELQEVRVVIIINKRMKGRISIVFIREKCYYNKVKGNETSGAAAALSGGKR